MSSGEASIISGNALRANEGVLLEAAETVMVKAIEVEVHREREATEIRRARTGRAVPGPVSPLHMPKFCFLQILVYDSEFVDAQCNCCTKGSSG